jgi:uncharacterized protein (TIGR03435 family)
MTADVEDRAARGEQIRCFRRPILPGRVIMSVSRRALICLFLSLPAVAQSPAFDVVSIKPDRVGDPRNMRIQILPGGRVSATAIPPLVLLGYAYDIPMNPSSRVSGVPDWAIRERYDVEANAPVGVVPAGLSATELRARMRPMFRALLSDRFKLAMRTEQKEMTVYALTVASGGPKLRQSEIADKDCALDTAAPESCHQFIGGIGRGMHAKAVNMDDLAHFIENWTDFPVVNRTALDGLFTVETEGWTAMRLPPPPPDNIPAARPSGDGDMSDPARPTIFAVLRKLGLELKQQKAPVPVYTVEHMERPAAN